MKKSSKIVLISAGVFVAIIGILAYYQSQGFLKVFPSLFEWRQKQALKIDEDKFIAPEGTDEKRLKEIMDKVYETKEDVESDPSKSGAWLDFGNALEQLNDHEGAIEAWKISYELTPTYLAASNIASVYQYFILDFEQAEDYYYRALDLSPANSVAFDGLIDLYRYNLKEKQYQLEAITQQAIRENPQSETYYLQGLIDFFADLETRDIEKAKKYFERYKELDAQNAQYFLDTYPVLR